MKKKNKSMCLSERVYISMLTMHIWAEREAEKAKPAFTMLAQPFVMNLKVKRRTAAVWALRLPAEETDCSDEEL